MCGFAVYASNGTSPLLTFTYNYDNINRVTDVWTNGLNRIQYTYDDYGKLTGATQGSDTYAYTYDLRGNITGINKTVGGTTTTKTLTYDTLWRDRLMSVNGKALVYDDAAPGLPTKYQNGNATYNLSWNEQGNLEMVIKGVTVKNTSYGYYSDGLRAYKTTTSGVRHDYYYDGDRLIAEKFGTSYLLYHYDETDSIYSITYNNGTSSSKYYLFKNLQGDVVEIRDYHNNPVANYLYDPYGNIISITDANGNDISADTTHIAYINPIRYRSYYYDVETGFYYLKSRYYDPAIGRFISADKLISPNPEGHGLNLFAYCGNDPVNNLDPNGDKLWHWVLGLGIVGGAAAATVFTCGGFTAAAFAIGSVASGGVAATTSGTIAASAFIGTSTAYTASALYVAGSSDSVQDFCEQGNWGTVVGTVAGGTLAAYQAYVIEQANAQYEIKIFQTTYGTSRPNNSSVGNSRYIQIDQATGQVRSDAVYDATGHLYSRVDYMHPHNINGTDYMPHIHLSPPLNNKGLPIGRETTFPW